MTTSINLAGPDAIDRVLSLMERYHDEVGIASDEVTRKRAVEPLLTGTPHGAIWTIGPQRAPLGYVLVSFGWSVQLGGTEAWVKEIFIRSSVRGRGIGTEVLHSIAVNLSKHGITSLHVRMDRDNETLQKFFAKVGFDAHENLLVMTDSF